MQWGRRETEKNRSHACEIGRNPHIYIYIVTYTMHTKLQSIQLNKPLNVQSTVQTLPGIISHTHPYYLFYSHQQIVNSSQDAICITALVLSVHTVLAELGARLHKDVRDGEHCGISPDFNKIHDYIIKTEIAYFKQSLMVKH